MGAAKFPEEIVERFVESSPTSMGGSVKSKPGPSLPRPTIKYCPLCFEGYLEESALDDHVARSHSKQHVYLKVNGRIVRDVCWIKVPPEECDLVLLQVSSLNVVVQAEGEESRRTIGGTASLMDFLHSRRNEGVIRIQIQGGLSRARSRSFRVANPSSRPAGWTSPWRA
jgi:hypothetical protein